MNKTLNFSGKSMVCASFEGFEEHESKKGIWLSQIRISGYENLASFKNAGEVTGFIINILDKNGIVQEGCKYKWTDTYDENTEKWAGGYWFNIDHDKAIGQDEEPDYFLVNGASLWTQAPAKKNSAPGYYFVTDGNVLMQSETLTLNFGGKTAAGNMMAVDNWLSEIKISGYENLASFKNAGEVTGFIVNILDKNGIVQEGCKYKWSDTYDENTEKWAGGYWFNIDHDKAIGQDEEPDYKVLAGSGLWTQAPARKNSAPGYYMTFPGPNVK